MNIGIEFAIFILQLTIIRIIMQSFIGYELNNSKLQRILLHVSILVISPIFYYFLPDNHNLPFFMFSIMLLYIILLFKSPFSKKFLAAIACTAIISLFESLTLNTYHILLGDNTPVLGYYTYETLIADLIILIILVFVTYLKKNLILTFDSKYIAIAGIHFIISALLLEYSYRLFSTSDNMQKNLHLVIFNVVWLLLIIYLLVFIRNIEKNKQLNILLELNKSKETYYKKINEKNTAFSALRHDYLDHLKIIEMLIRNNKIEESLTYINKITNVTLATRNSIDVGNLILNSIITDCIECYKNENIEFQCSGMFPNDFYISDVDLCTIFSNLLNNAFEANRTISSSKYVYMKINIVEHQIIVIIKNPVENQINFQTSKNNKSEHGFGISNVYNTLANYKAQLQYKVLEHEMNTILIFTNITNYPKGYS